MFACPAAPPTPVPAETRPRYELTVQVRRDLRQVDGNLTVRFTPNRPTDRLVFRLWPNGPLQRRGGSRLDVGTATADEAPLRVQRPDPTTLVLRPDRVLDAGSSLTVHLAWRLRVPGTARDRIARYRGGLRLGSFFPILAWNERRGWVTDPPARILGESSTSPTADFDVHIVMPRGMRALVSGSKVGPGHWRATAVRDVAVAVGRYSVVTTTAHAPRPVTVQVAVGAGSRVPARPILRRAVHALQRLARLYGPYRWSTYTVVVPPDLGNEGIEYPTLVYVGYGSLLQTVIDHETAHQWFYSLVGNDQARDPWLDETLATWAELRLGGLSRFPPGPPSAHVGASMGYWNSRPQRYFSEIYIGGVRALTSLGSAQRVNCALRHYAARNAYAIARPADLLDELNRVIPGAERRLRRFGIRR